jgi:hypothetical protein
LSSTDIEKLVGLLRVAEAAAVHAKARKDEHGLAAKRRRSALIAAIERMKVGTMGRNLLDGIGNCHASGSNLTLGTLFWRRR